MTKKSNSKASNRNTTTTTVGGLLTVILVAIVAFLSNMANNSNTTPGSDVQPTTVTQSAPQPTTPATQAAATSTPRTTTSTVQEIPVGFGVGYKKGFWEAYFNQPTGSSNAADYVDGLDVPLVNYIAKVTKTLDIAAFEMNNTVIETAILDAHKRGVKVRVVTDDEHGIEDEKDFSMRNFIAAGIPVVDDARSGLMHDKFMILDGQMVVMGSWNYTINDTYRNDNNALFLWSPDAVKAYQTEFNEMFEQKKFGTTSPKGSSSFTQDGTPIEIYFAAEDDVTSALAKHINGAKKSIKFMAFSFTENDIGDPMLARAQAGVTVTGVFESRGSVSDTGELSKFFCAGLDARQDGNRFNLHHKVIIIDDETVVTGSFNFSGNAINTNDENLLIIKDKDLAKLYVAEFDRVFKLAKKPTDVTCS